MQTRSVTFPCGPDRLSGRLFLPPGPGPWPAAVLVHGLGSGGATMRPVARDLARIGVAALAFDVRGHGGSSGAYIGDASPDILAAADFLADLPEIDPARIGVMGHSSGAREALIACVRSPRLAAIVCTSTPPDGGGGDSSSASAFYQRVRGWKGVSEYPRDGALPWLNGRFLRATSWSWSVLRGYRLRIRWQETLVQWGRLRAGLAVQDMEPRPLLLVHCLGDRAVPAVASEVLYQKASDPKDLMLMPGGWHSAPLLPGRVRRAWISWLAIQLKAGVVHGSVS